MPDLPATTAASDASPGGMREPASPWSFAARALDRLFGRLLLPLRPRSWRIATGCLAIGLLLALAPWHELRYPVGARARAAPAGWRELPRDWVAIAEGVQSPQGFRPFEPVLEEVAGAPPLTWHRLHFHLRSRGGSGEVASYANRRIDFYGGAPYDRKEHSYVCPEARIPGEDDLCELALSQDGRAARADRVLELSQGRQAARTDWLRGRNVLRWVHEQGHFYEGFPREKTRSRERQLGSEIVATSLVFAFAEHLGRDLSPTLARHILLAQLVPVAGGVRFDLEPAARRDLVRAFDDLPEDDAGIERLAAAAVLVLRASGFRSFGDVWRFAHESDAAAVLGRVRRHAGRLAEGFGIAVDVALAMGGADDGALCPAGPPQAPSTEELGPLVGLSREACLEIHYERYGVAVCGDPRGDSARVEVRTTKTRRLVVFLSAERREKRLAVLGSEDGPSVALVFEEGQAAVWRARAIESPCACRVDKQSLAGPAARGAVHEAAARVLAILRHAAADIAAYAGPVDQAMAEMAERRLVAAFAEGR